MPPTYFQTVLVNGLSVGFTAIPITGSVAHDAVDSGNPVKIGGYANVAEPVAVTSGDRVNAWFTLKGAIVTAPLGASALADSSTFNPLVSRSYQDQFGQVCVHSTLYNGASFDRHRANESGTALASAVRAVTTNTPDLTNYNGRGVAFILNVSANPGGVETLSLKVQAKDPISGNYVDICDAGVVITAANGTTRICFYPGILTADAALGTFAKSGVLGRTFRGVVTHSAAGNWTYSVSYTTIV